MGKNCFNSSLCPVLFGSEVVYTHCGLTVPHNSCDEDCYGLQMNFVHLFSCTRRSTGEKQKITVSQNSFYFRGNNYKLTNKVTVGRKLSYKNTAV